MTDTDALSEGDTLPQWLHQRFGKFREGYVPWDELGNDDRSYWAHEAAAVRRAVARGGFKDPEAPARPRSNPYSTWRIPRPEGSSTEVPVYTARVARENAADALARMVHERRTEVGMTLEELADRTGLERADVVRLEAGGTVPTTALVERLDRALKAPGTEGQ